jgi:hypothetical protein
MVWNWIKYQLPTLVVSIISTICLVIIAVIAASSYFEGQSGDPTLVQQVIGYQLSMGPSLIIITLLAIIFVGICFIFMCRYN